MRKAITNRRLNKRLDYMDMKRLGPFLCFAITTPAFALTQPPRPGDRIGVLRMSDHYTHGAEQTVAKTVQTDLRRQLQVLGFDAFDTRLTYEELMRQDAPPAEFYVETASSHTLNHAVGGE